MRVLIVEDNRQLCNWLKMALQDEGYAVDAVYDGEEGLEFALLAPYDVIILDLLLPKKDGIEVCRTLRRNHVSAFILMLTARDSISDRVQGLDSGADDYVAKPFAVDELQARLRALLRRTSPQKSGILEVGDLHIDPATHFVERAGQNIELTAKEYALLEYFARHTNQIITRDMIESHIWNDDYSCNPDIVKAYIRRLRRKIDDPFEVKLFETIRGAGYRLRSPSST
jgi:DNA-binding response OmpR family regulator